MIALSSRQTAHYMRTVGNFVCCLYSHPPPFPPNIPSPAEKQKLLCCSRSSATSQAYDGWHQPILRCQRLCLDCTVCAVPVTGTDTTPKPRPSTTDMVYDDISSACAATAEQWQVCILWIDGWAPICASPVHKSSHWGYVLRVAKTDSALQKDSSL